jgi:calcineurin-like phosphoesterase family protein
MKTFLTSDHHLGETRMELFERPFKSAEHQCEELVRLHNEVVNPEDLVYFVGDVLYSKAPEYLPWIGKFNGKKILIRGNHDIISDDDFGQYFDEVVEDGGGLTRTLNGIECYITHYPTQGELDIFNLVGHVHSAWRHQLNMFNIGVDANHFYPVNADTTAFHFDQIVKYYDEDIWVAYNPLNSMYKGVRGKPGRYFK